MGNPVSLFGIRQTITPKGDILLSIYINMGLVLRANILGVHCLGRDSGLCECGDGWDAIEIKKSK